MSSARQGRFYAARLEQEAKRGTRKRAATKGEQAQLEAEYAELKELFKKFDINGDGVITQTELRTLFQAIDPDYWTNDRVAQLMSEADLNGDGSIKYEEFIAWILMGGEATIDMVEAVHFKPQRSINKSSLVADCRSVAASTDEFIVTLEQGRKDKLGIVVDKRDTRMLIIKAIGNDGLVATFNASRPDRQVNVGDMIAAVNQSRGDAVALVKELNQARFSSNSGGFRTVTLAVQPKESGYRYVERLEDSYDVSVGVFDEDINFSLRYAKHKELKDDVMVKSYHHKRFDACNAQPPKGCQEEVEALKQLDHPNILKLFAVYEDFLDTHLVMEPFKGGELIERLLQEGSFGEREASLVMQQVLCVVIHLKDRQIVHRDIRLENLLLQESSPIDCNCVKLTGFSQSKIYERDNFFTQVGWPIYRSPQVNEGCYTSACDAWSCGIVLYMLLCGYPPWAGETEFGTVRLVQRGALVFPAEDWEHRSPEAVQLVTRLLNKDERDRMTASEAFKTKWITTCQLRAHDLPLRKTQNRLHTYCGTNRFKKAALNAIAKRMTPAEIDELKHMFKAIDTNGDNTVTLYELKEGLERMGKPETMANLRRIMEEIDVDGSRRIDYSEFLAATLDMRKFHEETACLRAFRIFDRDGSGRITRTEIKQLLEDTEIAGVVTQECVDRVLKDYDKNNDGEIDFREFMDMLQGVDEGILRSYSEDL